MPLSHSSPLFWEEESHIMRLCTSRAFLYRAFPYPQPRFLRLSDSPLACFKGPPSKTSAKLRHPATPFHYHADKPSGLRTAQFLFLALAHFLSLLVHFLSLFVHILSLLVHILSPLVHILSL